MERQPKIDEDRRKELSEEEARDINNLQDPKKKVKTNGNGLIEHHGNSLKNPYSESKPQEHAREEFQLQLSSSSSGLMNQGKENNFYHIPKVIQKKMSIRVEGRGSIEEEAVMKDQGLICNSYEKGIEEEVQNFQELRKLQETESDFINHSLNPNKPGQSNWPMNFVNSNGSLVASYLPKNAFPNSEQRLEQERVGCVDILERSTFLEIGEQDKVGCRDKHERSTLLEKVEKESHEIDQKNQEMRNNSRKDEKERPEDAIRKIFPNCKILKKMGEGTHGFVYKIQGAEDGKVVVIKLFQKVQKNQYFCEALIISVLGELFTENRHLLERSGLRSLESKDFYGIVSEAGIASLLTFKQFFQEKKIHLSEKELLKLLVALWFAVKLIFEKGICHRDLKLANIIIYESGEIEIIDYSIAIILNKLKRRITSAGTPGYWDLNLIENEVKKIGSSSEELFEGDLYSIGVLVLQFANYNFKTYGIMKKEAEEFKKKRAKGISGIKEIRNTQEARIKEGLDGLKNKPYLSEGLRILLHEKNKKKSMEEFVKRLGQFDEEMNKFILNSGPRDTFKFHCGLSKYLPRFNKFLEGDKKQSEDFCDENKYLEELYYERKYIEDECKYFEEMANHYSELEAIDQHPLSRSFHGIQLLREDRDEKALELFHQGTLLAQKDKDKAILLNNIACLLWIKENYQESIEFSRKAFWILNQDVDGNNNDCLITKWWLKFPWEKTNEIFEISLEGQEEKIFDKLHVALSFRCFDNNKYDWDGEENQLKTLIFFNLCEKEARIFSQYIASCGNEKYKDLLAEIETFCFYFNHGKSRKLNKYVKFDDGLEFFIQLFSLVSLFEDQSMRKSDSDGASQILDILIEQSNRLDKKRKEIYTQLQKGQISSVFDQLLKNESNLLFIFIGLPLYFNQNQESQKQEWNKREYLLKKIERLSMAADEIVFKFQYKINFLDPEGSLTIDRTSHTNPLIDLLGREEVEEFEIRSSMIPFLIEPISYEYKTISKDLKELRYSMEGIEMRFFSRGEIENAKNCQEWFDENFFKIISLKKLKMSFFLENSRPEFFQLLEKLKSLELLKLEFHLQFQNGEGDYPANQIANFIKSQKDLKELILGSRYVSVEKIELCEFKNAIESLQKLERVELYFSDCSNFDKKETFLLVQNLARLPLLKYVKIHLTNCANLSFEFEKELLKRFLNLCPNPKNVEANVKVEHKINSPTLDFFAQMYS